MLTKTEKTSLRLMGNVISGLYGYTSKDDIEVLEYELKKGDILKPRIGFGPYWVMEVNGFPAIMVNDSYKGNIAYVLARRNSNQ